MEAYAELMLWLYHSFVVLFCSFALVVGILESSSLQRSPQNKHMFATCDIALILAACVPLIGRILDVPQQLAVNTAHIFTWPFGAMRCLNSASDYSYLLLGLMAINVQDIAIGIGAVVKWVHDRRETRPSAPRDVAPVAAVQEQLDLAAIRLLEICATPSECCVCLEVTTHALTECGHALCDACCRRIVEIGRRQTTPRRITCPVCRRPYTLATHLPSPPAPENSNQETAEQLQDV